MTYSYMKGNTMSNRHLRAICISSEALCVMLAGIRHPSVLVVPQDARLVGLGTTGFNFLVVYLEHESFPAYAPGIQPLSNAIVLPEHVAGESWERDLIIARLQACLSDLA